MFQGSSLVAGRGCVLGLLAQAKAKAVCVLGLLAQAKAKAKAKAVLWCSEGVCAVVFRPLGVSWLGSTGTDPPAGCDWLCSMSPLATRVVVQKWVCVFVVSTHTRVTGHWAHSAAF